MEPMGMLSRLSERASALNAGTPSPKGTESITKVED